VHNEQRLPSKTPESRAFVERVQLVMNLTARLNVVPFDDLDARRSLLGEIFGQPIPDSLSILPPFYCDYGLGATFGERVFINQGCFFLDLGGITIGHRVLIGPRVTLSTAGHPVEPDERFDGITHAPIVIEDDVWIGCWGRHRGRERRASNERCDGDEHRQTAAAEVGLWLGCGLSQGCSANEMRSRSTRDVNALGRDQRTYLFQLLRRLLVDLGEQVPIAVVGERHGAVTGALRDLRGINSRKGERRDASVL
jgi:hypothetical protein